MQYTNVVAVVFSQDQLQLPIATDLLHFYNKSINRGFTNFLDGRWVSYMVDEWPIICVHPYNLHCTYTKFYF